MVSNPIGPSWRGQPRPVEVVDSNGSRNTRGVGVGPVRKSALPTHTETPGQLVILPARRQHASAQMESALASHAPPANVPTGHRPRLAPGAGVWTLPRRTGPFDDLAHLHERVQRTVQVVRTKTVKDRHAFQTEYHRRRRAATIATLHVTVRSKVSVVANPECRLCIAAKPRCVGAPPTPPKQRIAV